MKRKLKRSVWLPALLLVYLAAMAVIFRDSLTVYHDYARFFTTIGVELAVIVALFFFLRKKEKLRDMRENQDQGRQEQPK